jgi:1,4-alpha-glucan branching enzyme
VYDPATGTSAATGRGELIITTLYREAMPLIRYNLEDLVEVSDDDCPCGWRLPLLRVLGRSATGYPVGDGHVDQAGLEDLVLTLPVEFGVLFWRARAHRDALERVRSAFALLLTSVGVPMFLAGEEFADVHDLEYADDSLKMSDPVDWGRRGVPGHRAVWDAVADLMHLRTSHASLQRNEIEFFYFHPETDNNEGARVFAYCRTSGRVLGSAGQVIVVANAGAQTYSDFVFPYWPWGSIPEVAIPLSGTPAQFPVGQTHMSLSLGPFQVRVFRS